MLSETVLTSKREHTGVDISFSGPKEPITSIMSVGNEIESGEDGVTVQSQYSPKIPEWSQYLEWMEVLEWRICHI